MRPTAALAIAAALGAVISVPTGSTASSYASLTAKPATRPMIVGVTVDTTNHLSQTLDSLRRLPGKQWVRLVMDIDRRHPSSVGGYPTAAKRLAALGPVMGELADSSELKGVSATQLAHRATTYVKTMGDEVAVWEIGNEVNGDWTGKPATVARKVRSTYRGVRNAGGKQTALTLYENQRCGDGPSEASPAAWSRHYLPRSIRGGLTYVLLSYYEPQCHDLRPTAAQWRSRFRALHGLFPNAKLGFGEIGMPRPATTKTESTATSVIRHYYRLDVGLPYVIGGNFYWYYVEDMTPWRSSPLWHVLRDAIS